MGEGTHTGSPPLGQREAPRAAPVVPVPLAHERPRVVPRRPDGAIHVRRRQGGSTAVRAWRARWIPTVALVAVVSILAAAVAARISGPGGPWLWNLDMPKLDYPFAVFFHDALAAGHLPLWNDQLGMGFPLYAEGQIGAFYPPNWLIFQLPPLQALDVTRVLHVALAGFGTGLIALRLTGSRSGAVVAATTAALCGGIVTKLEWTNVVVAWAWVPWILLPLTRRPAPSRTGVAVAGVLWGIQALAGHPNTWALTGIAVAVVMFAAAPRRETIVRIAGFACLGLAVGAVQVIPTAVLLGLSPRAAGIDKADLFNNSATPFDLLGLVFANVFAKTANGSWDLSTVWHPQGFFGVLEAGVYVGMPVLGLALVGARTRRGRPYVALAAVAIAIPILGAFRPDLWAATPVLDGLRHPARAYMFLDLALGILAAIGIARLAASRPTVWRLVATAVAAPAAFYALVLAMAANLPATFDGLLQDFGYLVGPPQAEQMRLLAISNMTNVANYVPELLVGLAATGLVWAGARRMGGVARARWLRPGIAALAVAPLAIFSPAANSSQSIGAFSYAATPFIQAIQAAHPYRLLTLGAPGWYPGIPDQPAAAGVPDVLMFSSLDLEAIDQTVSKLQEPGADPSLRRLLGIDVVATFGSASCPGQVISRVTEDQATICRDTAATRPPIWIPASTVTATGEPAGLIVSSPGDASVNVAEALADARPASAVHWDTSGDTIEVDAPGAGWVLVTRSWYPSWQTEVDGTGATVLRFAGVQLVKVPAGRHTITQSLTLSDAWAGVLLGILGLAIAVAAVVRDPRRQKAQRPSAKSPVNRPSSRLDEMTASTASDGHRARPDRAR